MSSAAMAARCVCGSVVRVNSQRAVDQSPSAWKTASLPPRRRSAAASLPALVHLGNNSSSGGRRAGGAVAGHSRAGTGVTRLAAHAPRAMAAVLAPEKTDFKSYQDGDVIFAVTDKEQPMWLEVQVGATSGGAVYATSGGYELVLKEQGGSNVEAELLGPVGLPNAFYDKLKESLDKEAVDAVKEILNIKQLPKGSKVVLKDLSSGFSYEALWSEAAADATQWVAGDGEVKAANQLTPELAGAVGQAGELVSLLQGKRGVVLVQLWTVKDKEVAGAIFNPLAVRAFRQALQDPALDVKLSLATTPSGDPLGLTAIVYANTAPFDAWATHLGELGVQSALVADSAQHKVMIGRMLGYSEPNIISHIESKGQEWTTELRQQMDEYLNKLSSTAPSLPWRDATPSVPSAAAGQMNVKVPSRSGFGGAAAEPKKKAGGKKKKR